MLTSVYTKHIPSPVLQLYSHFLTFYEKAGEPRDAGMMDIDIFLTAKRSKYHKCTRFYIIRNDRSLPYLCKFFDPDDIDGMIKIHGDICPLLA